MKLLLDQQRTILLNNGVVNAYCRKEGKRLLDFFPVVNIEAPADGGRWLLTEIDPKRPDLAYGLCNPGWIDARVTLGWVSLKALERRRDAICLGRLQNDVSWRADMRLSRYAEAAGLTVDGGTP